MPDHPTPAATLTETVHAAAVDLADLVSGPPDADRAPMADRLSEELAEAAAMLRALPARPAEMSGHDRTLLAALRTAHAAREDIGETIARALARLAAELGGSTAVLANRAGSWEASAVADLLRGTVGENDEALGDYSGGPR